MDEEELRRIECDVLLEAAFRRYGHDFRGYARASLLRRLDDHVRTVGLQSIGELIPKVLRDPEFFVDFIDAVSIPTTEMFRDPEFFESFREKIVPVLQTYPAVKIWHAGCATGEEAYSVAILLHEAGLLDAAVIYATDHNQKSIEKAKNGIYNATDMRKYSKSYFDAGGRDSLSSYYHSEFGHARMARFLRDKIAFGRHNLVTDGSLGEMNVILCRNVLIYFGKALRDLVLVRLSESLCHRGFLCVGNRESLATTSIESTFEGVCARAKIYRRL